MTTPTTHPAEPEQGSEPWLPTADETAAELAVIGALLTPFPVTTRDGRIEEITSPTLIDIRRVLRPEHFFEPRHQLIATVVYELADAGHRSIDPVVVSTELARRGNRGVLDAAALSRYMRSVPTVANAPYYADLVRAGADRRTAYAYGMRIAQYASSMDGDRLTDLVTKAHGEYLSATAPYVNNDLMSVGNRTDMVAELLAKWGHAEENTGMTTGLPDVDAHLNVDPGGMVVLAGRPGSGKSLLGSQIAWHFVAERGEGVLSFSAEMTAKELMERDLARIANVRLDSSSGKTKLTPADGAALMKAAEDYQMLATQLWYDDTPTLSIQHIRARHAEVSAVNGPPALVVIDYLQLMQMPKADRRDLAIGEVTRQLKVFAQEANCLVLLLCQLNRGPESRPGGVPMLADLRDSGAIEQDPDVVMLLHDVPRYDESRQGVVDLILAKQRKGGHGITVTLADRRAYAGFGNWSRVEERKGPAAAGAAEVPDLDSLTNGDAPDDGGW